MRVTAIVLIVLSVLLIAEFVMAAVNLWTGRTMPMFEKFTGRLAAPGRRDRSGVFAFALFGLWAAGLFAIQVTA